MRSYLKSKTLFFVIFLNLAAFIKADAQAPAPGSEITISMDFKDVSLKDLLKVFSIQSGLNFIASEAVSDREITLYLDKVPLDKAMDKIFKANNLSYEMDQESNIFWVKDWGKPEIETVTRVFYLKHATVSSSSLKEEMSKAMKNSFAFTPGTTGLGGGAAASEESGKWAVEGETGISKAVKKLLSEKGSLIEDYRTNSLIVSDVPKRVEMISAMVAALDIPAPQVILEVEMLDVSKNTLEKIGVKFGDITTSANLLAATITGASRQTGFPLKGYNPSDSRTAGTFTDGTINFGGTAGTYQILLNFIRAQTDTKFLARPRLLTTNNEPATIMIVTNEVIGTTQEVSSGGDVTVSTTSAERTETGVALLVTPQINMDAKEITMFIMPSVSEAVASNFTGFRDPEKRVTKSLVRVKDGETVVIGGLIRRDLSQTVTKVPFLGDIPIFGALFRHKNQEKGKERELLVFITPHIVKENTPKLAQAKKIPLPLREQDTASGVGRDLIIKNSLSSFENKVARAR